MLGKWATIAIGAVFGIWLLLFAAVCALQDRLLFNPDSAPLMLPPEGVRKLDLVTSDGESIFAFYAPAVRSECPTILFLHNNQGRIDTEISRLDDVTPLGLGLLLVEWRGYAGASGKPSEDGFHRDARAAWDWLTTQADLSPEQIIVHGHSIGTGPAIKLSRDVEPGAVILEAPYYSMLDLISRAMPILPAGIILKHKFRTDQWIVDVEAPILIAHGALDETIAPSQSERLVPLAKGPVQRWIAEDADHFDLTTHGLYEDAIATFLEENGLDC
ncbi:MAG: alpha/beta hydrolase [Pseudomonadota bacterium]